MTIKNNVSIKGTKDGLIFLLNDNCSFEEIINELKDKLENSYQGFLTGPIMRVIIKTGYRKLEFSQQEELREIFKIKGNLFIQSIESEFDILEEKLKEHVQLFKGNIRSGQVYKYDGNVLLIGDVNPGGNLMASGDIFVFGALRGIAHAGFSGDKNAIIAASTMEPTQLRITNIISHPPENKLENKHKEKFAYINNGEIVLDKIKNISKLRKGLGIFI